MKRIFVFLFIALATVSLTAFASSEAPLITQSIQKQLTPKEVLQRLMQGNQRFVKQQQIPTDFIKKAKLTASGQYPAAVILSCIDSRVPPEIIFDQNVGNIFVTRVAANVLNSDVLGGLEFATAAAGAKLIVVLGHDSCGAVRGACENVKLGHLTQLLAKIQPAVKQATNAWGKKACGNPKFIDAIAADNVRNVVRQIPQESPIIAELIKEGKVKVIGAMYHLSTGRVTLVSN